MYNIFLFAFSVIVSIDIRVQLLVFVLCPYLCRSLADHGPDTVTLLASCSPQTTTTPPHGGGAGNFMLNTFNFPSNYNYIWSQQGWTSASSFVQTVHMCPLSFSTVLNLYLMEIEDDTKSRTIQEILLNVTMSIISQLSVSLDPEVEAIFTPTLVASVVMAWWRHVSS